MKLFNLCNREIKMRGTVKVWMDGNGYGFITPDDDITPDTFVHASALPGMDHLRPGTRVVFDIVPGRNGKTQAVNVAVVP